MQLIQARFRSCMRHLYPEGKVVDSQLRDLVRVFSMGWLESLIALDAVVSFDSLPIAGKVAAHVDSPRAAYRAMVGEAWVPGDEWKWWITG